MHKNKYLAEFIGTFTLTLVVILTGASSLAIVTPVAAGLTLMVFVYTIGPISGAHINPAITVALFTLNKIKAKVMAWYILAQFAGAMAALYLSRSMVTFPTLVSGGDIAVGIAELIGTFFLAFGIASVVIGKVHQAASGLVIGGSLLLGIIIASSVSNGILNPAVATGVQSISLMYIVAPIIGAIAGMWVYKFVAQDN